MFCLIGGLDVLNVTCCLNLVDSNELGKLASKVNEIDLRISQQHNSNVTTEAEFVQRLKRDNLLVPASIEFEQFLNEIGTNALHTISPKYLISRSDLGLHEKNKMKDGRISHKGTQGHFDDALLHVSNSTVGSSFSTREDRSTINQFGEWLFGGNKKKKRQDSDERITTKHYSMMGANEKPSFKSRKPDIVLYPINESGELSISFLGEIKGRYGNNSFNDADVGQILDTSRELLSDIQINRVILYAMLTDGYRYQYFKIIRGTENTIKYEQSKIFLGEAGWKVGYMLNTNFVIFLIPGRYLLGYFSKHQKN